MKFNECLCQVNSVELQSLYCNEMSCLHTLTVSCACSLHPANLLTFGKRDLKYVKIRNVSWVKTINEIVFASLLR